MTANTTKKPHVKYGTLPNADQWYPVSYTIDNSGNKHPGLAMLKGGDLTENQIIELYNAGYFNKSFNDDALYLPRPINEYHEDMGFVLWWKFPIQEPPFVGAPDNSDWPGYHTHFTILPDANRVHDYHYSESPDLNCSDAAGGIFDYPAAARAIALWLEEYCDKTLPYPQMIAEAARNIKKELDSANDRMQLIVTAFEENFESYCDKNAPVAIMIALASRNIKLHMDELNVAVSRIDTPEINNFYEGLKLEAAHQTKRWGPENEENHHPAHYMLVMNKLLGKLAIAIWDRNPDKFKHHCITAAAVMHNAHRQVDNSTTHIHDYFKLPAHG